MPQSKKRKDKRDKPVKHTPRTRAFSLTSALDLQTYITTLRRISRTTLYRYVTPAKRTGMTLSTSQEA